MAKVLVNEESLTNIANAIREKNSETTTYKPSEMAEAIQNISSGGATPEKGIVINEWDSNGYATDITVIGIVEIPDYYLELYNYNAKHMLSKTTTIRLPDRLTSIGDCAFRNRHKLTSLNIPDSVTSIGDNAFDECRYLVITKLPSALVSIGNASFKNCSDMVLTELPSGLTSIGDNAFSNCNKIDITKIPDSVTTMGSRAFYLCERIKTLELSKSLVSIGAYCFNSCSALTTVTLPNATVVPELGSTAFGSQSFETPIYKGTGYIYVPDDLVENFKAATNWSTYGDQIRPISDLNNLIDLSNHTFPVTFNEGITVDYDASTTSIILNGTLIGSCGFNIPIVQELIGNYTLSYSPAETNRGFYVSIDNITETTLNGWGATEKTFTLTEQPSQLMFWFEHSDSKPERNVYENYTIKLKLVKNEEGSGE